MRRSPARAGIVLLAAALGGPGVLAPPFGPGSEAVEGDVLRLEADLSERRLRVIDGVDVVATYPIAVGARRHATPTGEYSIERMVWHPRWVPPDSDWARGKRESAPGDPANPMQVVKIFFRDPAYYIHGTNAQESLGEAASHGCLRMHPDQVRELGLLLMERTGDARGSSWVGEVLSGKSEREVTLAAPIPMLVRR